MSITKIAFLILLDDKGDFGESLLHSLRDTTRHTARAHSVILAHAATHASASRIRRLCAEEDFELVDDSEGLARSLNRQVSRLSLPLVAFMDQNLILRPGWLEPMIEAFRHCPSAFAVGNVHQSFLDGTIEHAGIVFGNNGRPINFQPEESWLRQQAWREFPAVSSACCIVRRERFLAIGGFDDAIDTQNQIVDLCLRARTRGWPSLVASRSRVCRHPSVARGGKSTALDSRVFFNRWQIVTSRLAIDWAERHARALSTSKLARSWWDQALAKFRHVRTRRAVGVGDARPNGPIRVLVDFGRLASGGANGGIKIFVVEMLAALRNLGSVDVVFLWLVPANLATEARAMAGNSDEIWLLPSPDIAIQDDSRVHKLTAVDGQLARNVNADVVYAPFGTTDFQSADIPTVGVAVDVLHRDYPDTLPSNEVVAREAWFDRMAHTYFRVQCISQWTATQVRKHYPLSHDCLVVTHCAVHSRIGPITSRKEASEKVFLYPANAWVHKNHDTLLVAYRHYLRSGRPDPWKLVLSGHRDAAMNRILGHASALGLDGHVQFVGFLDIVSFSNLWAKTGALVFSSLHEGFGIPVLEAMTLGVPIVADRIGSISEVAADACLYTDMRSPSKIAAALHRVQDDAALRESLAIKGRQMAAKFSLETEAARLLAVFREAVTTFQTNGITWRWAHA